jgi:alpha-N-arabinofuranosidase
MHASQYGRGQSLHPVIKCKKYSTKEYDDVPLIDSAAVLGDDDVLTVFVLNRSMDRPVQLTCDLRAFDSIKCEEHIFLHHTDVNAINTEQKPDEVTPRTIRDWNEDRGKLYCRSASLELERF